VMLRKRTAIRILYAFTLIDPIFLPADANNNELIVQRADVIIAATCPRRYKSIVKAHKYKSIIKFIWYYLCRAGSLKSTFQIKNKDYQSHFTSRLNLNIEKRLNNIYD